MNQSKTTLWTKDFIIASSVNFAITLVFYLLVVTIGVYAVNQFHASTSQAGLVTGMFIIGALIGRLLTGRYIESIGRKKTLFIGFVLFILTTALYFLNYGITFLMIVRLLHGIANGMASTAVGTIVALIIPAKRKGEGFCLALAVICLITGLFLHVPEAEASTTTSERKGFQLSSFIEPKALPIGVITLVVAFCYSGVLSYINFYAIQIHLVSAASFFFLVYSIAVLASRPFTGRLLDQKGANSVMYPAFVVFAAGMVLLSTAHSSITLLAAGVLIGLGFGNMQSVTQAVAVKLTPPHRMGLATSTFFIFLDAGLGFGPYLLGFLIPITGYSTLYLIMGIVALATAVLYYFLHGRKESLARASAV